MFKIDNEIITSIDIYEEIKFLKIFNPEVNSLNDAELFEISKNSIIKDKVKKIEILNFVQDFKVEDKFFLRLIKIKYPNKNINSIKNFENYLEDNDLKVGKYLPKVGVEIKSVKAITNLKRICIIIFAWNFSNDIVNKLKKFDIRLFVSPKILLIIIDCLPTSLSEENMPFSKFGVFGFSLPLKLSSSSREKASDKIEFTTLSVPVICCVASCNASTLSFL